LCGSFTVQSRTKEENGLFDFPRSDGDPLLLIVDRRSDPVTPLLMQWTYQALVHEVLGFQNHRVDLSKAHDVAKDFKVLTHLNGSCVMGHRAWMCNLFFVA
jgi:hypothetical protein